MSALCVKHMWTAPPAKGLGLALRVGRVRSYGGLAEFERDLIRAQTGEGRERARRAASTCGDPCPHAPSARQGFARPRRGQGDAGR